MNDRRNMILAMVLSALVLFGGGALTNYLYPKPIPTKAAPGSPAKPGATPAASASAAAGASAAPAATAQPARSLDAALKEARVQIETPKLKGSISLLGAQIDDLQLTQHTASMDKNAPLVRLLSPDGTKRAQFARFGWTGDNMVAPNANTVWTASGAKLTPETPVTLSWDNAQGQRFLIALVVDKDYLFTITQSVENRGTAITNVKSNGVIGRNYGSNVLASGLVGAADVDTWTIHIGPMGTSNGVTDYETDYTTLDENPAGVTRGGKGGWVGFGDTYWLAALAPAKDSDVRASLRKGGSVYQADFETLPTALASGRKVSQVSHFFAGAKEMKVLDRYEESHGIANLGKAIDWGWFEIIAKPLLALLLFLFSLTKNFGFAIILLTIIVKAVMFPIAQKQFASMAKMRVLQPRMKALQERFKDDKTRLQKETLELYQKEKVNPASGCLPIFIQIPIWYALYKVLLLAVEMRHAPFIGWIKDLAAPDPSFHLLMPTLAANLPAFLTIGVLPIIVGITMYFQFKLSPQSPDPVQAQVFSIMPWFLMFIMAPFAAGLQLYWAANNTLTILQQRMLYRKYPMPDEPAKT